MTTLHQETVPAPQGDDESNVASAGGNNLPAVIDTGALPVDNLDGSTVFVAPGTPGNPDADPLALFKSGQTTKAPEHHNPVTEFLRRHKRVAGIVGGLAVAGGVLFSALHGGSDSKEAPASAHNGKNTTPAATSTAVAGSHESSPVSEPGEVAIHTDDPYKLAYDFATQLAAGNAKDTYAHFADVEKKAPYPIPISAEGWQANITGPYAKLFANQNLIPFDSNAAEQAPKDGEVTPVAFYSKASDGQAYKVTLGVQWKSGKWQANSVDWKIYSGEAPVVAVTPEPITGSTAEEIYPALKTNLDCMNQATSGTDIEACKQALIGTSDPANTVVNTWNTYLQGLHDYRAANPGFTSPEITYTPSFGESSVDGQTATIVVQEVTNDPQKGPRTQKFTYSLQKKEDGSWVQTAQTVVNQ